METRAGRRALRPRSCLCLEGETPTARRARWTSLFGVDLWRADETKKARSVVALSCVPRGERGSPVSPPAAGRCSGRGSSSEPGSLPQGYPSPESEPLSLATVRPLVRMSTDQHAATGTCECWAGLRYVRFPSISRAFWRFPQPFCGERRSFRVGDRAAPPRRLGSGRPKRPRLTVAPSPSPSSSFVPSSHRCRA